MREEQTFITHADKDIEFATICCQFLENISENNKKYEQYIVRLNSEGCVYLLEPLPPKIYLLPLTVFQALADFRQITKAGVEVKEDNEDTLWKLYPIEFSLFVGLEREKNFEPWKNCSFRKFLKKFEGFSEKYTHDILLKDTHLIYVEVTVGDWLKIFVR